MELRLLGHTGIKISPIGLGTVKLGRNQSVKYPQQFELPDDRQVLDLLALAWDLGINLLDTAPAYGSSEQRLGQLLARLPQYEWIISTKVGEEFRNGQSSFDFSAAATRVSIEHSLRRLGREVLDIVLIHSDGNDSQILQQQDCLEVLQQCQQDGLIRAIGMSSKTPEGGLQAVAAVDVMMLTYNLEYHEDLPVIAKARQLNKGVLIKKAFLSGHIRQQQITQSLQQILTTPGVSSVISGTINPAHLHANVIAVQQALAG